MTVPLGNIQKKDIGAVVTTYRPDENFLANMARVAPQVGTIVIVDDTASTASRSVLKQLPAIAKNIIVLKNEDNFGTAKTLNIGIGKAAELNYKWIVTLDQDSLIEENLIDTYLLFINSYTDLTTLGVINSNYKDKDTGLLGFSAKTRNRNGWAEVPTIITSGSLFSVATFQDVGPIREEFFMDWADYDFCLRARQLGKHNFVYINPLVTHSIGAKTAHKIFSVTLPANNHNSFRCYLIGRNLTILIKEYVVKEFRLTMFYIAILGYKAFSVIAWEKDRAAKLRNFFIGIKDGLFNRTNAHWEVLKNYKKKSD